MLIATMALSPATAVFAAHELAVHPPSIVSTPRPGAAAAHKARILRLTDGTLVVAYADAIDLPGVTDVWDLHGVAHPPRDIFVRWSRDNGLTWAKPINLSQTAARADPYVRFDPDGTGEARRPYYGDSSKPNLFAPGGGNRILVTWIDRYCGPGLHGVARYPAPYPTLGEIEVPFGCLYAARLLNTEDGIQFVPGAGPEQITDASRDAIQDVPRGTGAGFAVVWQEDPIGLQPGEAEGPGDGGSGAKVSHGTDIWYMHISMKQFLANGPWSEPVPISDNAIVGSAGASRPNLALVKRPDGPAQAVLVYEETKGSGGVLEGKNVILHNFTYDQPPVASAGTAITDPLENSRRARVVAKAKHGAAQGTRMIVFWRQGLYSQGGPADVMARIGRVPEGLDPGAEGAAALGLRVEDLWPAVDGDDPAASLPPLNLSAERLDEATDTNPIEDARAHRAMLDGDSIVVGYTYTPDQPVARYTTYQNYNYYIRRSLDGGRSWTSPDNVSGIADPSINVVEPRMIGTPSSVSGSELAEDQRDPAVFYVAWGTQQNQYEATAGPRCDLDLYLSRTTDFGATYDPALRIADGAAGQAQNGELQLRTTPDGSRVFAVWMRTEGGSKYAITANAKLVPGSDLVAGCSLRGDARIDPLLPTIALLGLAVLIARRARESRSGRSGRLTSTDPLQIEPNHPSRVDCVWSGSPREEISNCCGRTDSGNCQFLCLIEHEPRRSSNVLDSQS